MNLLLIKHFGLVYRLILYLLSIRIVSDVRDTEIKCILLQEESQSSLNQLTQVSSNYDSEEEVSQGTEESETVHF